MKLIPNQKYLLQYSGEFCHAYSIIGREINFFQIKKEVQAIFIGTIDVEKAGKRNIFYQESPGTYLMFDANNVESYLTDLISLEKEKEKLQQRLKEINKLLSIK
jgi:hypothetical protein